MSATIKLTDEELIRVAMRLLGQRTSAKKKKSSAANAARARKARTKTTVSHR